MGYQPLRTSSPPPLRSPCHRSPIITPNSDRPSGAKLMARKDNKICPVLDTPTNSMAHSQNPKGDKDLPKGKLTLIREFQREYRQGKEQSLNEKKCTGGNAICGTAYKPGSTRIKLVSYIKKHILKLCKFNTSQALKVIKMDTLTHVVSCNGIWHCVKRLLYNA